MLSKRRRHTRGLRKPQGGSGEHGEFTMSLIEDSKLPVLKTFLAKVPESSVTVYLPERRRRDLPHFAYCKW